MIYSNERGSVIDGIEELVNYIKIPIYSVNINGKEFWADSESKLHQLRRALDINYGIKVVTPKCIFK